jgi:hypothetical protein
MLSTNPNFDAKHGLPYKTPAYLIEFDGEDIYYYDYVWSGTGGRALVETVGGLLLEDGGGFLLEGELYKKYLDGISGLSQKITPEEGRSSIGGLKFELLDINNEITELLSTDSCYFHRKKVTVKAGYAGMTVDDMVQIMVGWITGLRMDKNLLRYIFDATDPMKWMQRKIFRGAEDSTVFISGNPLNILLACITSTGNGTNGNYDYYPANWGLALDDAYINVAEIEQVRDDWFPGDSHYMRFEINERIVAKDFFETEIFKVLNLYPVIDGQGRFSVKPFKPPLAALEAVQSYSGDNIIGFPQVDFNLTAMVNEVEIHYDWNATNDKFENKAFYIDPSIDDRGPGKKPIVIKSRGLHTSHAPASIASRAIDIMTTRKNRIFGRFANPPIKLTMDAFFDQWLSEVGDIVPFTHYAVPDVAAGTRGLTAERMEVTSKVVKWRGGTVEVQLLNTGFAKGTYQVISPTMTITAVTDQENFTVSVADAVKYANLTLPEVQICDAWMHQKVSNVTVLAVNTTTGTIQIDDAGLTLQVGWIVVFADYDNATAEQKKYGYIADSDNKLGTANDDAHLIVP